MNAEAFSLLEPLLLVIRRHRMASKQRSQIVLVDYDNDVLLATTLMLKHLGYRVRSERTSEKALRLFSKNPDKFGLAIIEPVMPGLGGIELAFNLLSIKPDLPILFHTAYLDQLAADAIETTKIGHIFPKPLTLGELKSAVRKTCASVPRWNMGRLFRLSGRGSSLGNC
jgi:two-component system, cell cycle sensor histidine kinase and response regulator CckA